MSDTVTKKSIVDSVSSSTGYPKERVYEIVNSVIGVLNEAIIDGNRIELRGFGVIEPSVRKQKKGYNFKTGDEVVIPERRSVKFKTSKHLDLELNS